MKKEWPGALHATEIPYVFDTVQARYADALTANDKTLAEQVQRYWVNFAKTSTPNGEGLPAWPRYDAKNDQIMLFPARVSGTSPPMCRRCSIRFACAPRRGIRINPC
jgi:para-nitrobenzyl esterase